MIPLRIRRWCGLAAACLGFSVAPLSANVPGSAGIVQEEFIFTTAPYPSCHAATIVETRDRTLVAAWFGGTAERAPDVGIWVARRDDRGWSEAVEVANGVQPDGSRLPTWNPVLFQPEQGDLHLYYKVGPSPSAWWGMVLRSSDGGRTWSKPERLPAGTEGPAKNKPLELDDTTWISGVSTEGDAWRTYVELTTDRGGTWRRIGPINDPAVFRTIQPTLLLHAGGRLQLLARSQDDHVISAWSEDGGATWGPMEATVLPNNNSGLDGVTLVDGRQLLVYNHSLRDEPGMGHKGRGILNVAVSRDGKAWEAALVLDYLDQPERQFSYPSVIQASDGTVHIVYTWHRERIKHVVIDPALLEPVAMPDGEWPETLTGGFRVPARTKPVR